MYIQPILHNPKKNVVETRETEVKNSNFKGQLTFFTQYFADQNTEVRFTLDLAVQHCKLKNGTDHRGKR